MFSGGDAFRVRASDALDGIDRVVDRQVHHGQVSRGMHRRRLNAGRPDELQERLVPLDDRIYGGRGCGFGALGVAKPKPAATTVKAMVAINAKDLWRIMWDNSARVVGSALMTVGSGGLGRIGRIL